MAIGIEHRSKFAALHRLHEWKTFSGGTKNSKQTNKQTKIYESIWKKKLTRLSRIFSPHDHYS